MAQCCCSLSPYKGGKDLLHSPNCQTRKQSKPPRLNAIFDPVSMDSKENEDESSSSEGDPEDLDSLKALTQKLKLQTRRPSYLEWQERVQSRPWKDSNAAAADCSEEQVVSIPAILTNENSELVVRNICGFDTIDDALEFLRKELREMQLQDNRLARQLIRLRSEIHRLKVEQVCNRHKEMLEDATFELEECGEESDLLCDIPMKAAFALSTPLKHIGLTKMNINSRRFSLC